MSARRSREARAHLDTTPSRSADLQSAVPQVCDLQGLEILRRAEFQCYFTQDARPAGMPAIQQAEKPALLLGAVEDVPASVVCCTKSPLQPRTALSRSGFMLKRFLPLLFAPLLLAGCTSTFTNLTPLHQTRNVNNLYPVEVAMTSRQQTMRWDSIRPQILIGTYSYPMRPTTLMTNRWEGLVPVPPGSSTVHYRYKFDYNYNAMGSPRTDSALSQEYVLRIAEP
jgi:hypothetical protein